MALLGCVIPGRPASFEAEQVEEAKFMFSLPNPATINHVVVFLMQPLPEGAGASVYLNWPFPKPSWQLLGFLTNEKPSAIFKIAKTRPVADVEDDVVSPFQAQVSSDMEAAEAMQATLGVSVEPIAALAQQTPAAHTAAASMSDFSLFTQVGANLPRTATTPSPLPPCIAAKNPDNQKMIESFYHFVTSFSNPREDALRQADQHWVPLGCLDRWKELIVTKMDRDPNWWRK